MAKEIEKKFRLAALPPREVLENAKTAEILQGYLLTASGELRVRRKGKKCFLTVKGDGTLVRREYECRIPAVLFWPLYGIVCLQAFFSRRPRRIKKTRYSIPFVGVILEVDEYAGALAGLVTLEIEFPSEAAAEAFRLPEWAAGAEDVTSDRRYKNKALAVDGLPRDS